MGETLVLETDFSQLTLGDVRFVLVKDPAPGDMIEFADKCIIGGVKHWPVIYMKQVFEVVVAEFVIWMKGEDEAGVREMLEGIEGL
jgi:hypothetical protein